MNKIKQLLALGIFSLVVLALPSAASAQWGNGPYGNNRYNRDIKSNLENLKRNAERFEKTTNRLNDRGGNGRWGNQTGQIEDLADDFKKATKDLVKDYGKGRNLNNSLGQAQRVLDLGSRIDQLVYNSRGNGQLQNEWNMMRNDLNVVAQTYGLNYRGGWGNRNQYPNNRNPRQNNNGDWRNRVPFPLPF